MPFKEMLQNNNNKQLRKSFGYDIFNLNIEIMFMLITSTWL